MIKLIREGSRKYPWILVGIMGVIVVTFVVGMGWWGFGQIQTDNVASVGELSVTRDEYRRVYQQLSRMARENGDDTVDDEEVRRGAVDGLVANKLWRLAAEDLGLTVTPGELRAEILKRQEFQRNGKFDPEVYRRLLAVNRLTPSHFENMERERLLVGKARTVVLESVTLTPSEIAEAETMLGQMPDQSDKAVLPARDMIVRTFLMQKQQRALQAYTESLKATIPIEIHQENL